MSNKKIQELISSYKNSLSTKATDLEQYCDQPLTETSLQELFLKAHRLAGSATSYGFPEISESASTLSITIKRKAHDCHDEVEHYLKKLIKALKRY